MIITSADGKALEISKDGRARVHSINEPMMHAMAEEGQAWTLPFIQTGAANTTDNAVFHFKNTSDSGFDVHTVVVSSAEAGLWSIYYGRAYSAGGTALSLAQLSVSSGKTQAMTAYYGTGLTLTGTAVLLTAKRGLANTPQDLLSNSESLQIEPGATFEVRFQAAAGSNQMAVTIFTHGVEPWENA